jgi:flavin-dependent dehydrogenase
MTACKLAETREGSRGWNVVLFEEKFGWEKPCGGGVTAKALRRYPFLVGRSEGKRVRDIVFAEANGVCARLRLPEPLAIFSRVDLNALLLRRAELAGAEIVCDRISRFARSGGGWEVKGRKRTYRADYLVLAAGARSLLRGLLTENFPARDFMLTFGYYVPGRDEIARIQFYRDFEGYAWAFPRPDHCSIGI